MTQHSHSDAYGKRDELSAVHGSHAMRCPCLVLFLTALSDIGSAGAEMGFDECYERDYNLLHPGHAVSVGQSAQSGEHTRSGQRVQSSEPQRSRQSRESDRQVQSEQSIQFVESVSSGQSIEPGEQIQSRRALCAVGWKDETGEMTN